MFKKKPDERNPFDISALIDREEGYQLMEDFRDFASLASKHVKGNDLQGHQQSSINMSVDDAEGRFHSFNQALRTGDPEKIRDALQSLRIDVGISEIVIGNEHLEK